MSEVPLTRLRQLRSRSEKLQETILTDLGSFVNKETGTFLRTPESFVLPNDVNVTTTCSCLMALALTNKFKKFQQDNKNGKELTAREIFKSVVDAPWMSSGLTANNAFTTTLVLRTLGFLRQEHLLDDKEAKGNDDIVQRPVKPWELHLGISDPFALALRLKTAAKDDPPSEYLWLSISDKTRDLIGKALVVDAKRETFNDKLKGALAQDLLWIIQSGYIYVPERFTRASTDTLTALNANPKPTGYTLAAVNHQLLVDHYPDELAPSQKLSLGAIAELLAADAQNFSINRYDPSAAVLYWFVDGVERGQIPLQASCWEMLCNHSAEEFNHQRSLVMAGHDAMMDPVAMGMFACLCKRLRTITESSGLGSTKEHLARLPSVVELESSIRELASKQTDSGIWPKYFPIFHYQDAGSNFCFTFELLEAILCEFGSSKSVLLGHGPFIGALEKAITWCEKNRLTCKPHNLTFTGWNSGGDLVALEKEQPESWATAVVHMFLYELATVISERIQHEILDKYNARWPKTASSGGQVPEQLGLSGLLDIEVSLPDGAKPLSTVLRTRIIDRYVGRTEAILRRTKIKGPLSALLFGPPGTSKTEITRAVAQDLGWPLVELTPSEFVKGTLANIYLKADEIFEDLMDLSGVVVFFDEMDALVQTRDGEQHLDIASQFLTTTMLPKLTRLHDQARVVFFMATNFQDRFDAAIKRAGRFDILLCMGPPTLGQKLDRLHKAYFLPDATDETKAAGTLVREYLSGKPKLEDQFELLTFGEFKSFINNISSDPEQIEVELRALGRDPFLAKLENFSNYVTLKFSEAEPLLKEFKTQRLGDLFAQKLQRPTAKTPIPDIIRYLYDRKESRDQY